MNSVQAKLFGTVSRGNRGKALESAVLASAGRWMRIRKMGAEAKWIGKDKETDKPIITQKKGPVDFLGCTKAGRFVCFDAKIDDGARSFPVGDETKVKPHQRRYLIDHGEFNAIAGLLLESMALKRFFWLDWRHLLREEKSILWQDDRLIHLGDSFHAIRFDLVPGLAELFEKEAMR